MKIEISDKYLPVYEALASSVRIRIIQLLAEKSMNIKQLAEATDLSSAILTMHVRKLEKAGLIAANMTAGKGGKLCTLIMEDIEIRFPQSSPSSPSFHTVEVSVGHYTDFKVSPTCGLASPTSIIGQFDDPRHFLDAERVNAKIVWFGQDGYLEYRVPNYLHAHQTPEQLEISMELSSEAPYTNNHWPSDITFFLNDVRLGTWTSPGDYGDVRGKYAPDWWNPLINQYGLLKLLRITQTGTFIDGLRLSDTTIEQLHLQGRSDWKFRLEVLTGADNVRGMTLFGKGFGNYNQDIVFHVYYK